MYLYLLCHDSDLYEGNQEHGLSAMAYCSKHKMNVTKMIRISNISLECNDL